MASPHFRDGRYSKSLPDRLVASYETSLRDPELLNLRYEIALLDARMTEMLQADATTPVDWSEIRAFTEQRRRLTESEQKRLMAMNHLLTVEQLMTLGTALVSIVKKHVTDQNTWRLIAEEMGQILNKQTSQRGGMEQTDRHPVDHL